MARGTQERSESGAESRPRLAVERRRAPRLPEELTAVITDSAIASEVFHRLPQERRDQEANWVAEGPTRRARAQRAVEVVRHALDGRSPG
ncbi:MAG: hypothetical protein ABR573_07150 [Candidatus Dormibacteria bacterium]